MKIFFFFFFFLGFILAQEQKFASLGNFVLEYGGIIQDCKLGYRTFGQLDSDKSNAILYPTWYGGTSEAVGRWIGPNKLVDSTKYFVIAVDALGNGVSSSPSHTKYPEQFPIFTIRDMVHAEYVLINEHLGIQKLFGIIGGSMGGMQAWQWLVSYPDKVQRAIIYVSTPRLSSYDLLIMHTLLNNIRIHQRYKVPENEIIYLHRAALALFSDSPEYRVRQTQVGEFTKFLESFRVNPYQMTSYDLASQIQAMLFHDIMQNSTSLVQAAKPIQADVLIVVSNQDHLLNPQISIDFAKALRENVSRTSIIILQNDAGHLSVGKEISHITHMFAEFWKNGVWQE